MPQGLNEDKDSHVARDKPSCEIQKIKLILIEKSKTKILAIFNNADLSNR